MKKVGKIYLLGTLLFIVLTQGTYAKMKIKKSSVAKAAVIAGTTSALAKSDNEDNTLKKNYTDEELVNLLKKEMDFVEIIKEGVIKISTNNGKMIIFNNGHHLKFYYGTNGYKISYKAINDFNANKNYLKIYRDDSDDICMEYDLKTDAGITSKHISSAASLFETGIGIVKKFLYINDAG